MQFKALLLAVVLGAMPAAAAAQVVIRPEREPARVAGQLSWYRAGEPVMHRGELYYPAGAQVFFNPTLMVLIGEYRGVPLYADPTIETGSVVLLPIGNGQMQPYERLRTGDLAGTSGSRSPSFPPETASALGADTVAVGTTGLVPPAPPVGDAPLATAAVRGTAPAAAATTTTIAPAGTSRGRGIWIAWQGQSWRAAGGAVRVGPQLVPIGTLNGRTVYRGAEGDGTIWIETAQGLASPWRAR
jgi:hypothetical protein